jgi:hypothetical protein
VVSVEAGSAVRAGVPADGQAFVHEHTAARTRLRGERRRHRYTYLPSFRRFARQDGQETTPARITAAFGKVVIPDQVGRLQVFMINGVVLADERQRRLMVEVRTCATHPLMRSGKQVDRLAPAVAAFDPPGDASLRTLQIHFGHTEDTLVGNLTPVG